MSAPFLPLYLPTVAQFRLDPSSTNWGPAASHGHVSSVSSLLSAVSSSHSSERCLQTSGGGGGGNSSLNPSNAVTSASGSAGALQVSEDGFTVLSSGDAEEHVCLAETGFVRGLHYWEWRVETYDGQGQIAVGVALAGVARDKRLGEPKQQQLLLPRCFNRGRFGRAAI
ncbi:unnamed protein product [Protopolystoma xenopodis]|uniref:B30.2/SPRY domain-containing protein n=1 Tax=Protopolystoma xenopodis TaxID=117903 RepID=A0A3S5CUZ9_9PLAT|nr:unnamed protein product [Protopolystoma xenopodis]